MRTAVAFDPRRLAESIGSRLRDLRAAMARYGAFSFRPDDATPDAAGNEDTAEAARALVLRTLAVASDPMNHRIMRNIADADAPFTVLAEQCSLTRVELWERVGDLVQTGLAARALDGDRVGLTDGGRALVELIDELTEEATRADGQADES